MKNIKTFKLFLEHDAKDYQEVEAKLANYLPTHSFLDENIDTDEEGSWIEFTLEPTIYETVNKELSSNYDLFVKHFSDWCEKNELNGESIMTIDEKNIISYHVTNNETLFRR